MMKKKGGKEFMKKRLMAFVLAAAMTASMVGCGSGSSNAKTSATEAPAKSEEATTKSDSDSSSAATESKYKEGEFKLRIATVVTGDRAWVQMGQYMADQLKERSGGAIEATVFPGGQLGNDEGTIDDMRTGALDIVIGSTQNAAPFVSNITNIVKGNVEELCSSAAEHVRELGYKPYIFSTNADCEAKSLGQWFARTAKAIREDNPWKLELPCAVIVGGETVVKVTGNGLGGRNQEIALQAAEGIQGMEKTVLFSLASDGTDGPTDAAGGIVDGYTVKALEDKGMNIREYLEDNDAYCALQEVNGLIMTGPTGTNVNDVTVLLIK